MKRNIERWSKRLVLSAIGLLASAMAASATTNDFKYLRVPEHYDDKKDNIEHFVDLMEGCGPIFNAAEPMGEKMIAHLGKLSINQRVKLLQNLGLNQKQAHAIASNLGKNIKNLTKKLGRLDQTATLSEAAGALSGGDIVGAGQAGTNSLFSGAAAAGGAWLGAKTGAAVGALAGPAGAAVGCSVGAVGGAVLSSYLYDWQGRPIVDDVAQIVSDDISTKEEQTEKFRRRVRVDIATVYPNGVIVSPENPLPPPSEIHRQAQEIRRQRQNDRVDRLAGIDECPHDPKKTKPGICGCGLADIDTDGDLVPDCIDECPHNPKRYETGPNGCGNKATVPAVVGKKIDQAVSEIAAAELAPAVSGGDPAPEKNRAFTIQSQSPPAGDQVDVGSPVRIRVHSDYKPTVPNVIGMKAQDAAAAITAAGFEPSVIQDATAPRADLNGRVKAQSPPQGQKVTLTVYKDFKNTTATVDDCAALLDRFLAAMSAEDETRAREVLSQSQNCSFYAEGSAQVKNMVCLKNAAVFLEAMKQGNHTLARALLAASGDCDFHDRYAMKLDCDENLNQMSAALQANDISRYRALLDLSRNCGYYASLSAALQDAERQAAEQRQRNEQLAHTLGQVLGGVLREMASGSGAGSGTGSGTASGSSRRGQPSGPPVIKHGACNDVRKAGANQPERHIMDLGSGSGMFVFEYETYTEEDQIIVSQGGSTLFNSGCVGTNGRKSVRLKKGFRSEVTVDVRPNCADGTNTQWEFIVHCPN